MGKPPEKSGPGGPPDWFGRTTLVGSAELVLAPPGLGFGSWLPHWMLVFDPGACGLLCVGFRGHWPFILELIPAAKWKFCKSVDLSPRGLEFIIIHLHTKNLEVQVELGYF